MIRSAYGHPLKLTQQDIGTTEFKTFHYGTGTGTVKSNDFLRFLNPGILLIWVGGEGKRLLMKSSVLCH
jgi:hypothetical protein